jgi:hypothetical protein
MLRSGSRMTGGGDRGNVLSAASRLGNGGNGDP